MKNPLNLYRPVIIFGANAYKLECKKAVISLFLFIYEYLLFVCFFVCTDHPLVLSFQVMPILSSFCVYSAVGIFALFLIQSTFFPACVFLDQKRIQSGRDGCVPCYTHKNYKPNKYSNVEVLEPLFKKVWGRLILSIPGKVSLIKLEDVFRKKQKLILQIL